MNSLATSFFVVAICHTFLVKVFQHLACQFPKGTFAQLVFHMMGEVELVLGFWAGIFVASLLLLNGFDYTLSYLDSLRFHETVFVFFIMLISSSPIILRGVQRTLVIATKPLPLSAPVANYLVALTLCPLSGSLISEPAAMTVTALLLKDQFLDKKVSQRFKYLTLAVLFVNISIGGSLTHFAAPPVLMVSHAWQWNTPFMFVHLGWKAMLAVFINACLAIAFLRKELLELQGGTPKKYKGKIKFRESLFVSIFLAGLVILGKPQSWWLEPILKSLDSTSLFFGTTLLTAFTDNAALTYLGSQVEGISDSMKYALMAGSIAGGGLTVIANAPNPAGFSILKDCFGREGISPARLAIAALPPTLIAAACLWLLPPFLG
jgi:hypothetical protein